MKFVCTFAITRIGTGGPKSVHDFMMPTRAYDADTPLEAVKNFWTEEVLEEYRGPDSLREFCEWMAKRLRARVSVYCVDTCQCWVDGHLLFGGNAPKLV